MEGELVIIHLHDKEALDPAIVGGKAASLARWHRQFRVPAGVVALPDGPEETIQLRDGMTYAVRSSAVDEDGPQHSFAGQHDSYLNVEPKDVPAKVNECYQSKYNERALAYRREHGLPMDAKMAVIVQEMVQNVVASGVAFSRDPLLGDVALIEADWGAGKVVDGEGSPGVYRVEQDGPGATVIEEPSEITKMVLITDTIKKLAYTAWYIEALEGHPIDMEWATDSEAHIWLLQVRPITA
jgi:pyruvate,water dikinase|tara:strand:- start:323 stop:1042 length:720 start_codon:yes stop_codon:yes gene_type:complete